MNPILLELFLKGIAAGFLVSIPLGPIGVLLVQRTMSKGIKSGMMSGLGVAAADTVYAIIAAFGMTFLTNYLMSQATELKVIGGIILLIIGVKLYRTDPLKIKKGQNENASAKTRAGEFLSMFFLTITNPMIIMLYAGTFALLKLEVVSTNPAYGVAVTLGIYFGAMVWWMGLTSGVNKFRNKIKLSKLTLLNKTAGIIIIAAAIFAGISVFPVHLPTLKILPALLN